MKPSAALVRVWIERKSVIDAQGSEEWYLKPKAHTYAVFEVPETKVLRNEPNAAGIEEGVEPHQFIQFILRFQRIQNPEFSADGFFVGEYLSADHAEGPRLWSDIAEIIATQRAATAGEVAVL